MSLVFLVLFLVSWFEEVGKNSVVMVSPRWVVVRGQELVIWLKVVVIVLL